MAKLRSVRRNGKRLTPGTQEFDRAAKSVSRAKPQPAALPLPAEKRRLAPPPPLPPLDQRPAISRTPSEVAERLERKAGRDAIDVEQTQRRRRQSNRQDKVLTQALEAVSGHGSPNIVAHEHLGTVLIDDPEQGKIGRAVKRVKLISTRDDPIGWMYQHKQLEREDDRDARDAEIRLMAARRFQTLYERAEIGGARAIDFTRDVVDGGQIITPDAMLHKEAQDALNALWRLLGKNNSNLVRRVLGEKRSLVAVAAMMLGIEVPADRREQSRLGKHLLDNLLEALDDLADHFGVRPKRGARGPRREHDRWDKIAPLAAIHPELAKAARRAQEGT